MKFWLFWAHIAAIAGGIRWRARRARFLRVEYPRLMAVLALLLTVGCIPYSDGERTGIVTKFSRKGWLCKTWEGEMQMPGFATRGVGEHSGIAANVWYFSAEDEAVAKKVAGAARGGHTVTLTYRQEKLVSPCRASTQYFVTDVRTGG